MIILVGKNGQESMKKVFSTMKNINVNLLIRRTFFSKKKKQLISYFRLFSNFENLEEVKIPNDKIFNSKVVIKWGNRIDTSLNFKNPIVYNNSKALSLISNKKKTRELLKKENVNTPFYEDSFIKELIKKDTVELEYPIVARPLNHEKGQHFYFLDNLTKIKKFVLDNGTNEFYYAPFLNKSNEYRVHCGLGKILSILEKPKPEQDSYVWNRNENEDSDGFKYIPWSEYNYDLCKIALDACKVTEVDFAAVDIIKFKNKFYILELNSSPSLITNDYTVTRYSLLFNYIFKHTKNNKLEHWNYNTFEKAKSLVWKNIQLNSEENIINKNKKEEINE